MGIILTRFRKKTTTLEVLENLESDIKHIEEFHVSTEQRHRTIVGHLVLYSVGLYVLAAVIFYFYYFPASLNDQLFYITPLLIFPIIIVFLKRLVSWYYHRKISRNQEKLLDMRKQKKQLLEEVMDKETYKVAKEILEKFAPDQLRKTPTLMVPGRPGMELSPTALSGGHGPIQMSPSPKQQGMELRRRMPGPPAQLPPGEPMIPTPSPPRQSNGQGFPPRPMGPPMPRPILPRDRSYLDKLVEYLVGDGPSNRYALVCRHCASHNGMALKEEFEYFAFRCCYCYAWNPARKQRPQAPKLEQTSGSELESASSTEEETEEESSSPVEPKEGGEPGEEVPSSNGGTADSEPVEPDDLASTATSSSTDLSSPLADMSEPAESKDSEQKMTDL